MLDGAGFDVRLFALPSLAPPVALAYPIYLTDIDARPRKVTGPRIQAFDPRPTPGSKASRAFRHIAARAPGPSRRLFVEMADRLGRQWPATLEEALANVFRTWRPDIVHTLGFDPAAYLFLRAARAYGFLGGARWVAQARGGPDLDLFQHLPERLALIEEVFRACDHFICDNERNYAFALEHGLDSSKIENPGVGVVSGAGGLDVDALAALSADPPSRRERIIVWPKTYETMSSKALPVFEALNTIWDRIQPARIECLWLVQDEVRIWFNKMLREDVKRSCRIHQRLDRAPVLQMMAESRIMLAPSLTDGIPNAMLEAMATGAFPIVSPLATITPIVENERNVLFARNLYPDEIAEALIRAMSDDALVDTAARTNLARVRELTDRGRVRSRVVEFYHALAASDRARRGESALAGSCIGSMAQ